MWDAGILLPQGNPREDARQFQGVMGARSVEHVGTLVQGGSWREEAEYPPPHFSVL